MKTRALAIALTALAALGLWLAPASVLAARALQQASDTPPPTVESCLTLAPDEQSACFATKVAVEELQRQTQEVIGITATAQAVEQQIQGTLAAAAATPTPQPTVPAAVATPEGFSVAIPGLNIRLNLLSLIGLAVCGVGGVVLIGLGIYLVRGAGGDKDKDEDREAPVPVTSNAARVVEQAIEAHPFVPESTAPLRAPGAARPVVTVPTSVPAGPAAGAERAPGDSTLAARRQQEAAPPGSIAVLVSSDGQQFRVSSGDFSIGRAFENDLVVDARFAGYENVSAEHARIVQDSSQRWLIEDLGSANGTYVNGLPTILNVLRDGWRVGFGPVEFAFRLIVPEEQR